MNLDAMMTRVKNNIGNRASGQIGVSSVDSVILDAINLAVPHTTLEAQPDYYNRTATISIISGTREYALPTVDTDANNITIKDTYAVRCSRADGTEISMIQLNYKEFVDRIRDFDQATEGTPRYFALWGQSNKLYLDCVPTEAFTLTLYVETYPQILTSEHYALPLPINDQWDLPVEAFATAHCYLKLQQSEMYAIWMDLYLKQKASISRTENQKHGKNIQSGPANRQVADPVNDPFIDRWN